MEREASAPVLDKGASSRVDQPAALTDAKRATSSDSQDSGVGQEDEASKNEVSGKPKGLQSE